MKSPGPAHRLRVQQSVSVSKKALSNATGFPCAAGRVHGHINHNGRSDDVLAGNATDKTAIEGILTIVAHHKIAIGRNFVWGLHVVTLGPALGVIFVKLPAVDPNSAVVNVERFPRKADDTFHNVTRLSWNDGLEYDDLLALGIAPKRHVPVGEGQAGVVADAAHDEVIADEQSVLHRAGGNDARLADRAVDEQKDEANPEPGDDFALNLGFHGQIRFFLLFLFLSFHVPPPPAALRTRIHCHCLGHVRRTCCWHRSRALPTAPDPWDKRPYNKTYRTCPRYHRPRGAGPAEKRSPANRHQGTCRFLRACWKRRSALRAWACPRRSSTGKSSAGN